MTDSVPPFVITGAGGLIGSHLLRTLAREAHVHATTHRGTQHASTSEVTWHQMDLKGVPDTSVLPPRADAVIHLAQSEHFREFPARAVDIFNVNVASVVHLLEYARRAQARTFVIASSGGVYGAADSDLTEDSETAARSDLGFYLGSKLCSEIIAEQYAGLFTVVVLRFFFVFGPGQRQDMLLPRLVRGIRLGQPVTLAGGDGLMLNPTYVDDAVRATRGAIALTESQKLNVGGPDAVSLRALCEMIGERVGRPPVFVRDDSKPPQHLVADISRLRRVLGPPQVPLGEALTRFVAAGDP